MNLDDRPLSEEDFLDLRKVCQRGVKLLEIYKGDYYFDQRAAAAARILSRHGVTASVNGRTGAVTFKKKES